MAEQRQVITIMQACRIAGVKRRTIYNWMKRGWIEYARTPSGSVRIYADQLLQAGDVRKRKREENFG